MNKNVNKKVILYILILIFAINIFSIISDALIDCSNCHTTDPGKSSIKAKDTIVINDNTCLKCHNPKYPPTPIGYNTHLAHVGKFSAKVNFLARHPDVAKSLQCSDCHRQIFDCTNCHVNGIPHITPPLGLNCQGCHNQIDNLFRHPTINLTIHNIFHLNSTKDCQMCHNVDSMKSLKLASGDTVPIDQAYNLCKQCHSNIYKLWDNGQHYANKTVPMDVTFAEDPNVKIDFENNWLNQNSCVNCHNPHNPSELYVLPLSTVVKPKSSIPPFIYIVPIIVIVIIIFVYMKYGKDYGKDFITKISSSHISLPESLHKLPKLRIPIPISITLDEGIDKKEEGINKGIEKEGIDKGIEKEGIDKGIDVKSEAIEAEKIEKSSHELFGDLDKKLENLTYDVDKHINNKEKMKGRRKIFKKYRGDILFILGIILMFGIFYIVFGTFMPMAVAISESMSPHIEKGDLIFYTDIGKIDNIKTFENSKTDDFKSFDNYGYVIIYKPFGREGVTPIIHRAMYYVNKGDSMWPGGPVAPSDGYITKGDNQITNNNYDQQVSTSLNQPVKKEWIEGIAAFRIPYIGYIRLLI